MLGIKVLKPSMLYILVTAQVLLTFGVNGLDIKADDLLSFRRAGWEGSGSSESYDLPSKFKRFDKTDLDSDVSGAGVWTENLLLDDNPKAVVYAFHGLVGGKLCDVTEATINVKYFSHHAAASVFPCKNGPGGSEYCHLSSPGQTKIEWMTQNMGIKRFDEIKLEIIVFPGGYIIFDDITISHNGREAIDDSCDTATTTEIISEPTATEESTTLGYTETSDTEGPGETWGPSTVTDIPETTTETDLSSDPTSTTEFSIPEIPETDPPSEGSSAPPSEFTTLQTTEAPLETTPEDVLTTITEPEFPTKGPTTEPSFQTTINPWQNVTEIDVQRDIPNNGRWNFDCAIGYADVPSSFSCQAGSVNIPPENLGEGFWTKCGFRCWIDYAVQPNDKLYKARIFQKNIMTEVIYDCQSSEFIPGSGWVSLSIPLNGVKSIGIRLDHMDPNVFTLLDKITIEAESM